MLVIADWRNLAKQLSHSIRSGSIALIFPTEIEEISHRIMKRLYCLRAEHSSDIIILANDVPPYWRKSYMDRWYSERSLEPVIYKGNRANQSWLFATKPEDMERLYAQLLVEGAQSIGAVVISERGLEADDIWGILATTYPGEVLGYSTDSDWAQLVSDRVKCKSLATGEFHPHKDIRVKWIGGDAGDNVPGCPKRLKNGELAKKNWGQVGAAKLLVDPDWQAQIDPDYLERNRLLTTLPNPTWDIAQAESDLRAVAVGYDKTDEFWNRYGITEPVRKVLDDRSNREIWLEKLRLHLLNKETTTKEPNNE